MDIIEMPMWKCPACHKEQQQDDYYFLKMQDTMACQFCEAEFIITSIDTTVTLTIEPISTED